MKDHPTTSEAAQPAEPVPSPGPWRIDDRFIIDANGDPVCDLDYFHLPNDEANARLIAAAPETAVERDRLVKVNKGLVKALADAEYAISNAARIEGARGPQNRAFDYEDFCCWAEHWVTVARAVLSEARK